MKNVPLLNNHLTDQPRLDRLVSLVSGLLASGQYDPRTNELEIVSRAFDLLLVIEDNFPIES
jgi:hypothetical protein